eukprot:806045-Pelagomonas_calceolata.AAC.12
MFTHRTSPPKPTRHAARRALGMSAKPTLVSYIAAASHVCMTINFCVTPCMLDHRSLYCMQQMVREWILLTSGTWVYPRTCEPLGSTWDEPGFQAICILVIPFSCDLITCKLVLLPTWTGLDICTNARHACFHTTHCRLVARGHTLYLRLTTCAQKQNVIHHACAWTPHVCSDTTCCVTHALRQPLQA